MHLFYIFMCKKNNKDGLETITRKSLAQNQITASPLICSHKYCLDPRQNLC